MSEIKNVELKVAGIWLYPKVDGESKSACIAITSSEAAKVLKACKDFNSLNDTDYKIIKLSDLDDYEDRKGFNVKSKFDFPYFVQGNKAQNKGDVTAITHGSKVVVNVLIRQYTYNKRKGMTAYIKGVGVVEMAEANTVSYDDFFSDDVDALPFY